MTDQEEPDAATEAVLARARELAELIARDPRFTELREMEDRVLSDPGRRDLVARYEQVALTLRSREQTGHPLTDEEQEALAGLKRQVHEDPELRELARRQTAYRDLLEAVNGAIHGTLDARFRGDE